MPRKAKTQAAEQPEPLAPAAEQVVQPAQERQPGEDAPEHNGEPKKWAARTHLITDPEAKMKFHFNHETRPQIAQIEFEEGKPSDAVRQFLKDNKFKWNQPPGTMTWNLPINYQTRETDRTHAKRTFWEAARLVRAEKGLPVEQTQGIPI